MSPPKFIVRLLSVAEEDLAEAITFIAVGNPAAATALADKMGKSLGALARHPHMGRVPDDPELMQLGYRYLIVDDYLIFYVVREEGEVVVHRILHGARDYRGLL